MSSSSLFALCILLVSVWALHSSVEAVASNSSCANRCDDKPDNNFDCQCNKPCETYKDCCNDYSDICLGQPVGSCQGKCDVTGTDPNAPCQCNKPCVSYGDCCPDYEDVCGDGELPGGVSNDDIMNLTEEMYKEEAKNPNNARRDVQVDIQGQTSQGSTADKAPLPLLNVSSAALTTGTIGLLRALHDNYIAEVGSKEVITDGELAEEKAFLDAVFASPVFQKARAFLIAKGYLTEANFRDTFYQIWFGLYSRSGSTLGSSGFEHVFLGELKNGETSGFHNWVYFNREEENGNLNYNGWLDFASFGPEGDLVAHNFKWRNNLKPISSMFVGTSPELELGLFTVCWYTRPNSRCTVKLNNTKFYAQTYDINCGSKKCVASSYADISI